MAKTQFNSRIGLIAATVGSAVGLGAVWRFPNEVHSNGGAAFLLIYVACLLLLGIPVMLAEFSLGRGARGDALSDFKRFTPRSHWWLAGACALFASFLISAFYMVVAGWTLEYLWQSVTGELYEGVTVANMDQVFTAKLSENLTSTWQPIIWALVVIGVNVLILLQGVQKGIERLSNLMMPLLFLLLLVLCCVSLSLPGASAGVRYFLMPDFSVITPDVCVDALGQAFFSLSLGMGILLTYSAYYPKDVKLTGTAFTVTGCALLVALLMGLIIFPAAASFGLADGDAQLQGTALVFITLPEIFYQMSGTRVWSILFFLLLAIAAITSTVSVSEVCIQCMQDRFKLSRKKSVLLVFLPFVILSPLCSLSLGSGTGLRLFGMSLFDFCDNFSTNYLLPIAAFLTCIYVGFVAPRSLLKNELTNDGTLRGKMYKPMMQLIRYVAPLLIIAIFIYKFF
ncbi:MAG: sodium-dependent transporter [Bacteroidales bacterium]|nr:sodium-dependent transporter [Bacteroidales bacterium]